MATLQNECMAMVSCYLQKSPSEKLLMPRKQHPICACSLGAYRAQSFGIQYPYRLFETLGNARPERVHFFWWLVDELKAQIPLSRRTVILVRKIPPNLLGTCCRTRKSFVIRLSENLSVDMAADTLLHEWAHGVSWAKTFRNFDDSLKRGTTEYDAACHDEHWGVAYGAVYRAFLDAMRRFRG